MATAKRKPTGDSFRIEETLRFTDAWIEREAEKFKRLRPRPEDKAWVKKKILHMIRLDQLLRRSYELAWPACPPSRRAFFHGEYMARIDKIDRENARSLKALCKLHGWFKISDYGRTISHYVCVLAQHAREDPAFQKRVFRRIESLHRRGEVASLDYAKWCDEIAKLEKRPLKYGMLGKIVGGKWRPLRIGSPGSVDARRKALGLEPLSEYIKSQNRRLR